MAFSLFFVRLLVPLALASRPRFFATSALALIVGLAIGKAELIGKKVAIGLSRYL